MVNFWGISINEESFHEFLYRIASEDNTQNFEKLMDKKINSDIFRTLSTALIRSKMKAFDKMGTKDYIPDIICHNGENYDIVKKTILEDKEIVVYVKCNEDYNKNLSGNFFDDDLSKSYFAACYDVKIHKTTLKKS